MILQSINACLLDMHLNEYFISGNQNIQQEEVWHHLLLQTIISTVRYAGLSIRNIT